MFFHFGRRIAFLKWCAKTFSSFSDVFAAIQLSTNKTEEAKSTIVLHPRALGGRPIYCRPGTTDWITLLSVFDDQYHLPPLQSNLLSCIVDLGANVGYTAAHFACIYPQARIIAVEMDFNNYEVAIKNVRHWQDRIMLINAAIWSANSEVTYDCDVPQDAYKIRANSFEPSNSTQAGGIMKIASAISMERLIEQFDIHRIDYLKVDIEGAEEELFLSSSPTWLTLVATLKVEIHRPQDIEKYLNVFAAAGFITYKDDHHWSTVVAFRPTTLVVKGQVIEA